MHYDVCILQNLLHVSYRLDWIGLRRNEILMIVITTILFLWLIIQMNPIGWELCNWVWKSMVKCQYDWIVRSVYQQVVRHDLCKLNRSFNLLPAINSEPIHWLQKNWSSSWKCSLDLIWVFTYWNEFIRFGNFANQINADYPPVTYLTKVIDFFSI